MIKGKLSNGFEIEVDEKRAKSHRFAKLMGKSVSNDPKARLAANADLLAYLIGEDGEEALMDYVESQTGEEATEQEMAELTVEIIKLMTSEDEEIKKS